MKILKTGLSLALVGLMTFSAATVAVSAAGDSEYTYSLLEDGTIRLDKYNGADSKVMIPSSLDGKTVTQIGAKSFEYNRNISEVEIPNTVSVIGEKAFNDCVNLKTVEFGDSVTAIEKDAFFSCTRLENVELPNKLQKLGDGAFYDCRSIVAITIPGTVSEFGEYIFGANDSLKSAKLEEGITTVAPLLFSNDNFLETVELPSTVKLIDRKAFYNDNRLVSVTVPSSVEEIGDYAFYNCNNLKQIDFNGTKIGNDAFSSCYSLETLNLSDNLKTIGNNILLGVTEVKELKLSKNLNSISEKAFAGSHLTKVEIDKDNQSYTAVDNVIYSKDMTKLVSFFNRVDYFKVPDSVTEICDYAFAGSTLTGITFPVNLQKIGNSAFSSSNLVNAIIPSGVTEIGESAFAGCESLGYLNFPSTVKEIPKNCFKDCSQLGTAYINDGVEAIGQNAFYGCSALESFALPKSVKELSANSFINSSFIRAVNAENNQNFTFESNAIYNKDKTELIMYADSTKIEFTVPSSVTCIGEDAFTIQDDLETLYIPATVTQIGDNAIGISHNTVSGDIQKENINIIGIKASKAYDYAQANDISFFTEKPSLNSEKVTLNGDETFKLVLNGAVADDVVFNSSDESIATVDSNGLITAKGKGETAVIASVSNRYFVCRVTVNSDSKNPTSGLLTDYSFVTRESVDGWIKDYTKANNDFKITRNDYPAIYCYTTEQYVPIVATQKGGSYLEETLQKYGNDYKQYYTFSDNLSNELQRFTLHSNTVLLSGTGNVSISTGTDSSVKSMRNAIGRQYVNPAVVSTSLSFEVANMFSSGGGGNGTVMEIYAPKGFSKGAYIQSISNVESEYELLLDKDVKYEVLDAGFKEVKYKAFPISTIGGGSDEERSDIRRFLKLKIIDTPADDEPATEPSQPTTGQTKPTSSQNAASATQQIAAAQATTVQTADSTKGNDSSPISTGSASALVGIAAVMLFALFIGYKQRAKNE